MRGFELKAKPTILKLGGSAITHKEKPFVANFFVIENLAREIAETKVSRLVIVHGGGSFGHPLAKQYAINEGLKNSSQIIGFSRTHDAMNVLNRLVVQALIEHNIPAVGVAPSSFVLTKQGRIEKMDLDIVARLLETGFVPVLYGDAVLDLDKRFAILSGDQLIAKLAVNLDAKQIIVGVDVDGLYTADPKRDSSAQLISKLSFGELQRTLSWVEKAKATDVTGGMYGKILELIPAIEHGVRTVIVNATKRDTVRRVLRNEKFVGTVIEKE
ncbi:MAG: isopentenyl phosphate kinase [Candidatus Bathyarchaeia archaeon]